jgi:hypothetical protein
MRAELVCLKVEDLLMALRIGLLCNSDICVSLLKARTKSEK